jgi:tetratricopeptide (TPR) repeat protein
MRRFLFALALSLLPLSAHAADEGKDANTPALQYSLSEAIADPQKRGLLLDELYARLKNSPSDEDAKRVDATIDALLQKTGNAASDVFMEWGEDSLKLGNTGQALDYFDMAALLAPNAAEPYFKRATVFYARNDFSKALADLQRATMLEPRHTGALLGLGTLFSDLDRDKEALAAYSAALSLNPHNEDAQKIVGTLRKKVEGEGI